VAGILDVRVVSPEQVVFEGAATSLVIPAWDGKVGILPGHAPMVALLGTGELVIDVSVGASERFQVAQGVLKVERNRVTILAEYAGREAPPADFTSGMPAVSIDQDEEDDDPFEGLSEPGNPLV
jgi:F-type H+-transporting ATPase subunit epsilon